MQAISSTSSAPQHLSTFDLITRGLVAGGLGGVVGAGTKLLGELVFPPRFPGEPIPPAVAVSQTFGVHVGKPSSSRENDSRRAIVSLELQHRRSRNLRGSRRGLSEGTNRLGTGLRDGPAFTYP